MKAKLETRDAEAKILASKLEAQEARAGELKAKLETRDAEAKILASKLEAQGAAARELKAILAARDRNIQKLKSSTSWRVTKPLRVISRALHYLRVGKSEARGGFGRAQGLNLIKDPDVCKATEGAKDPDVCKTTEIARRRRFGTEAENFNWYLTPDTVFDQNSLNIIYFSGDPNKPGETYRVLNYVEALRNVNVSAYWLKPEDLNRTKALIVSADLLIIYRHRFTEELAELVFSRKNNGKRTVYDVDDMMILPDLATCDHIDAIRFNKLDAESVRDNYSAHQKMLLLCDAGFASTSPLAETMRSLGKRSFIIPNGFGSVHLKHSLIARSEVSRSNGIYLRIGYSSGSRTHQKDFGQVASPLAEIMRKFDHVLLTTFGATLDFSEFPQFDNLRNRIEIRSLTQLDYLPYEIARFDINIAPLEVGNLFCECKSQLKYYESALVGVPTIASPTVPFKEAITNGVNGLLAETEEEWLNCLEQLICEPQYRFLLAQNAMHSVNYKFGLAAQATAVADAVRELIGSEEQHNIILSNSCDLIQLAPHKTIATNWRGRAGKVAMIIPLYNYDWCIEECLNSVKQQTIASDIDVIVIDDCSSDRSADVALDWLKLHGGVFGGWTLLRHEVNAGLARTRNTGIAYCQSSYYFPLDADNRLDPQCIEQCLAKMCRNDGHKSLGAVYPSRVLFGDVTYLFKKTNISLTVGEWDPERLTKGNYIDAMALIRKSAWRRVGGYADLTERGGWQDYDFWCKFVEYGLYAEYESSAVAFYRTHCNSMLHKRTHLTEVYHELVNRMKEKHPWLQIEVS